MVMVSVGVTLDDLDLVFDALDPAAVHVVIAVVQDAVAVSLQSLGKVGQ